ncbi:MAG: nucleoside-diphosphate sugar epimerase/dehydratase [Actinomycetota bacterium]
MAPDLLAFVPAFWFAGLLRNEVETVDIEWTRVAQVAVITAAIFVVVGWFAHLYRNRFRTATFEELLVLGGVWGVSAGGGLIVNLLLFEPRVPTSVFTAGMMLVGLSLIGSRIFWRLMRRAEMRPDPAGRVRVMVFGAGDGGTQVIKSMLSDTQSRYVPVGILDDDPRKRNRVIEGVRVIGTSESIPALGQRADMVLIAIPSASSELISRIQDDAQRADLDVMILPSTTELFGLMATIETARPIEISDLLGRDEVQIDDESVSAYLKGEVVLVTGAGGSIGSELCRQILRFEPRRLVMVDRDETALQAVQISVAGHGLLDDENLVLADIRDTERMLQVFREQRPAIVFHAAALKHLPLLEAHPREGLLTNVLGTRNVLEAANAVGVSRFVNVSTDKAANPTSVLGTTKRLAEALTVQTGAESQGQWISVRFGNVIGSRGSVLPTFEAQIRNGGPVTVTHREATRFFMSIPEASRLVLQAAAIGSTGETLVLDMGEPMRILELAQKLIRHHDSNAEIVFTGLRPNEKLHEELGHAGEELVKGPHPRIWHTPANVDSVDGLGHLLATEPDDLPTALLEQLQQPPVVVD